MKKWIIAFLSITTSVAVQAATAVVDGVQSPAWLERNNLSVPIAPGMELEAGDLVRTGKDARLLLKMSEGSLVKLGENARFRIEEAKPKGGLFRATLSVLEGAFRFTTQAVAKNQKRDVRISIGQNATIGIRGTDVWGRGSNQKDIVCLIEGKVDVTGNDGKTLRMDQSRQFFQSARNAPPLPLDFVSPEQLGKWGQETEIETGKGARQKGQWLVMIGGFADRTAMLAANKTLRSAGFPSESGVLNTLRIVSLGGEAEAAALAKQLMAEFGFKDVKILK